MQVPGTATLQAATARCPVSEGPGGVLSNMAGMDPMVMNLVIDLNATLSMNVCERNRDM